MGFPICPHLPCCCQLLLSCLHLFGQLGHLITQAGGDLQGVAAMSMENILGKQGHLSGAFIP
jgi:hypothetical protein